jgi:hypothetical protein
MEGNQLASMAADTVRYLHLNLSTEIETFLEGSREVFSDDDDLQSAATLELLLRFIDDARIDTADAAEYWIRTLMHAMGLKAAFENELFKRMGNGQ